MICKSRKQRRGIGMPDTVTAKRIPLSRGTPVTTWVSVCTSAELREPPPNGFNDHRQMQSTFNNNIESSET